MSGLLQTQRIDILHYNCYRGILLRYTTIVQIGGCFMDCLNKRTKEALQIARESYGYKNQINIAVEELLELAGALAKYQRYNTRGDAVEALRDKIIEECGDVFNAIDHVQATFEISDLEIVEAAGKKGDRLRYWLMTGKDQEITTMERSVPSKPCPMCLYNGTDPFAMPCYSCNVQDGFKGFVQKKYEEKA